VKLLDLGLAAVVRGTDLDPWSRITRTGHAVGTLAYMAPEQLAGGEVHFAADVWSLGVTLFEAIAGALPFPARTPADLLRSIKAPDRAPLVVPHASPAVSAVIQSMLAPEAAGRPSMTDVAERLCARDDELVA
jgi:serine/threonine-protein kinase